MKNLNLSTPLLPASLQNEAQSRWQSLIQLAEQSGQPLDCPTPLVDGLRISLVFSDFVFKQCKRRPDLLHSLIQSRDLQTMYGHDTFFQRLSTLCQQQLNQSVPCPPTPAQSAGTPAPTIANDIFFQILRCFRHRELMRIAVRDICGWANLDETLADLSRLADACITQALNHLYPQHCARWGTPMDKNGVPQQLVVLGLGKLGAHELNFSSDIDLIFAYPQEGSTQGDTDTISNEIFFLRLCRDLIKAIGAQTPDGFVFRIDTRLRPFGEVGPLVTGFDKLETYYQEQGREWERYALIKARVVAGDHSAGATLLQRLQPFVYRRYLDYGVFDALRDMKQRITAEVQRKGLEDNIKLGPGGIREIEFFGQIFQLIRGGVMPSLQLRPIQKVLSVLAHKGLITKTAAQTLSQAYIFLRRTENRLQQWADQQTHRLPSDPQARLRLALSLGYSSWQAYTRQINLHRSQVRAHFNDLLALPEPDPSKTPKYHDRQAIEEVWQKAGKQERTLKILKQAGYSDPPRALHLIHSFRQDRALKTMSPQGRKRLKRLAPMVLEAVGLAVNTELVLDRIFDLLKQISQRTAYLALLLENPAALTHLVRLCDASPWIATFLRLHPVLLDELLDARTLYRPPRRQDLASEMAQRLAEIEPNDLEYQMESLRIFKQVNVLRVAASDITSVLPLMKVSDRLSDIAEIILATAVELCWRQLTAKYGLPGRKKEANSQYGFTVIAYGKLGGLELGYASDLDLVFLHAAEPGSTTSNDRPIDNTQFFTRIGQRLLHFLTTHTAAGILYDADMRLRPSGDSGMLVSHIQGFHEYQLNNAWTWEHQALIRARAITGDKSLQQQFNAIRREVLTQPRDATSLQKEVADMRARLRNEQLKPNPALFDIKQDPGGIVDIEFLVQYLILLHAHQYPQIIRWTDNVRLLQALNEVGIIDGRTAFGLRRAYLIYRSMVHRLDLQQRPTQTTANRFQRLRRLVIHTWNRYLGQRFSG